MWHLLKLTTISLRCIPAFFRSRSKQVVIEFVLRQQLATFAEKGRRPRITPADWGFWDLLSRVWSGWKEILVIVQPETVVRWHRKGFRLYWRSISKRGPGRPPIPAEVQLLIRRFADENGRRARRVRAELAKLGISVGLATVSRYLLREYTRKLRFLPSIIDTSGRKRPNQCDSSPRRDQIDSAR
jgi:hypothetical protein